MVQNIMSSWVLFEFVFVPQNQSAAGNVIQHFKKEKPKKSE